MAINPTIISGSTWKGSGPSWVTGPHQRLAAWASPFQLGKKALRFQPTIFVDNVLTFYGDSGSGNELSCAFGPMRRPLALQARSCRKQSLKGA